MKTDRELLELAAKAGGVLTLSWYGNQAYIDGMLSRWNPLTSDADAFRLADRLGLIVDTWNERAILATRYGLGHRDWTYASEEEMYDGLEATRRAITRAAAAIGEQK